MRKLFTEGERQALREASDEVVKRARTQDGIDVVLWSDGSVTGRMGYGLKGVPIVRAKTPEKRAAAVRAGLMLLADIDLYDSKDLGAAYKAYRWAAERNMTPGQARARAAGEGKPAQPKQAGHVHGLKPSWTVLRADARGKTTERVWRLPRLRWPGLAVWDHMGKWHGGRERYELVNIDHGGTVTTTGFTFKNLADLEKHLQGIG